MEYFLEHIAKSLRTEFGKSLHRHCLVFPGRRAGLYMLKYLAKEIDRPVWAPPISTINELFRSLSQLQVAGNELLLFELYRVYRSLNPAAGGFDDFYFWGDMLINDFDDTDKYLADASRLFTNIKELREIDQKFGGFSEEQQAIIKKFWLNFDLTRPTGQKSEFISLWAAMHDLYTGFRASLNSQNLAYEGMIFRDVAERSEGELVRSAPWDMVHFIGFNALNNCEKKLMLALKNAGKARFYWDYDQSFIEKGTHNSAGFFMSENLELFGIDMPAGWNNNSLLTPGFPAKRTVIETSSDTAQVKLVTGVLSDLPELNPGNAHHTAVILSDESLLVPLLSSLPDSNIDINITMGFPLKQTSVYTLVRNLMDLQKTSRENNGTALFHAPEVMNILNHHLIAGIRDMDKNFINKASSSNKSWYSSSDFASSVILSKIFTRHDQPLSLSGWVRDILPVVALSAVEETNKSELNIRNEFIYRIILSLNRLETIINDPVISFSTTTYMRLLDRLLKGQTVPFSGEPLSGIQVMGILETRALDFKNLVFLSVNEGVMPALSSPSSFIPFSLRQAFGLPSINHQESIYAYHFYRLLQRAENVTFIYNSNSEGLKSGEMSRFLIQMSYSKHLKPEFRNTGFEIRTPVLPSEIVNRDEGHSLKLHDRYLGVKGKALSPSAINTWLSCRMKFYFRYVEGLAEPVVPAEEIDPASFGNILHTVMNGIYSGHTGREITAGFLESISKDTEYLKKAIIDSIRSEFRNGEEAPVTGNELIVRDVMLAYVKRILKADTQVAPINILRLEEFVDFTITGDSGLKVRTGGYADRIDRARGKVRIVDYKTGIISENICSVDDLFIEDRPKDNDGWLQVLLYCEAYFQKYGGTVAPSVYAIRKMTGRPYTGSLVIKENKSEFMVDDYRVVRDQFLGGLNALIGKIFNNEEPFTMTKDTKKCRYCAYCVLCSR